MLHRFFGFRARSLGFWVLGLGSVCIRKACQALLGDQIGLEEALACVSSFLGVLLVRMLDVRAQYGVLYQILSTQLYKTWSQP